VYKEKNYLSKEGKKTSKLKTPKIYVSKPIKINLTSLKNKIYRADLEIDGIDHSGASYEGRVFLNNPEANQDTPRNLKNGYVGSIYVFAHGGCYGDSGHCEIRKERRLYDYRSSNPLLPIKKRLIITIALSKMTKGTKDIRVTIVPILSRNLPTRNISDFEDVVKIDTIKILTYA
jgi:hypothetical protein